MDILNQEELGQELVEWSLSKIPSNFRGFSRTIADMIPHIINMEYSIKLVINSKHLDKENTRELFLELLKNNKWHLADLLLDTKKSYFSNVMYDEYKAICEDQMRNS